MTKHNNSRSIYMDDKPWDELKAEAKKQDRSASWIIGQAVKLYLTLKKKK